MMVIQTLKKDNQGPIAFSNFYIKSSSGRSDIPIQNQYGGDTL